MRWDPYCQQNLGFVETWRQISSQKSVTNIACYIEYVFCKKRKLKLANIFKTLIYLVRSGFGPGRLEKSDPERAKKSPSFILFF